MSIFRRYIPSDLVLSGRTRAQRFLPYSHLIASFLDSCTSVGFSALLELFFITLCIIFTKATKLPFSSCFQMHESHPGQFVKHLPNIIASACQTRPLGVLRTSLPSQHCPFDPRGLDLIPMGCFLLGTSKSPTVPTETLLIRAQEKAVHLRTCFGHWPIKGTYTESPVNHGLVNSEFS